jgi:hypothetical protein
MPSVLLRVMTGWLLVSMHIWLEDTVFRLTGHKSVKVVRHHAVRNYFEAKDDCEPQKLRRDKLTELDIQEDKCAGRRRSLGSSD